MQVKKGTSRAVVLFPSVRLAIKFPLVHLRIVFRLLYLESREEDWQKIKRNWAYPVGVRGGTKSLLFQGLVANWLEFRFWRQTRNPFLQPTYFSFFGLFNVQRADDPCNLGVNDLWYQIYDFIGNDIADDGHHFANASNFGFRDKRLKMVDYGSRETQKIVARHGASIAERFDANYSWAAERAKRLAAREQDGH